MSEQTDMLTTAANMLCIGLPVPPDILLEAATTIERLQARVAELEKDAARYNWLRDKSVGQWEHPIVVTQERYQDGMRYLGPVTDRNLDKAIDAAIKLSV